MRLATDRRLSQWHTAGNTQPSWDMHIVYIMQIHIAMHTNNTKYTYSTSDANIHMIETWDE